MILDALRFTFEQKRDATPLFVRNLLKEQLQYYILNFIYNSFYAETFLFKGGTCLRFCFDLPRLSEDLDFDVSDFEHFSLNQFLKDLETYFKSKLNYHDFTITVSGVNKIIYLKFPILGKIGFPVHVQKPTEDVLFIRIDLSAVEGTSFSKELSLKSTYDFSFLIRRYSLSDLYAGKIAAVLQRQKMEGGKRMPRFKGRDFFDIWWFQEKRIQWNKAYLQSLIGTSTESDIREKLNAKIREADKKKSELKADLLPFFENPRFVEDFIRHLSHLKV